MLIYENLLIYFMSSNLSSIFCKSLKRGKKQGGIIIATKMVPF